MYVLCIFPYINGFSYTMFFFHHSVVVDYYFRFIYLVVNLSSARFNPTKPSSVGSPCGVPVTVTNLITATNPSRSPFWHTSLTSSSSHDTLPQRHSSHQESGTQINCYSQWVVVEVYNFGLVRPAIIPPTVVMTAMKLLKKKVLKCLWVRKDVNIGLLRPANVPQVIAEVVGIGILRPYTFTLAIT